MKDLLKKLVGLSPVIGSALGGPVGALLGSGVKAAASLITGEVEPVAIMEALIADPEKLRALEIQIKELELDELRIHAEDRDSARDANVKLAQAKHGSAWAPTIVSIIIKLGFFVVLYEVLIDGVPEGGKEISLILLGTLAASFTQVVNYWLGSSRGSKEKTQHLMRIG